ncbi:MAG: histidine--tRNA ligase [Candidatus Pacebacteria bacterium]|nr:histidine--tRNA ligase [Candidatus Paceibacterota bacterium]
MIKKEDNKKNLVNKDPIQSLKGMGDIFGDKYYQYQGLFEKAQEIAIYYGFKPIETPALEKEEVFIRGIGEGTDVIDKEIYNFKTKGGEKVALRPEYTASVMRSYLENGMMNLPQPVMLYSYGPTWRHDNPQKGRLREFRQFNLEILGTEKSIADAIIIQTLMTILKEFGFEDLIVDINSVGDRNDRSIFTRELITYYKKHVSKMCKDCQFRIQNNPLKLLDCKNEECQKYKELAPASINYLSNDSKQHFREVLQYLEEAGIEYRINNTLVRGLNYYTNTVFEVIKIEKELDAEGKEVENGKEKEITITGGGRYNYLARELGSKKDISAVGAGLGIDRVMMFKECKEISPKIIKKPKIYFLQLGFEAKLKSLKIMEILRENKIPVYQTLSKDSLSTQLASAAKMGTPHCIIFGQKEAMDGTVIIRNMKTHSQEIIKIDKLSEYVKKLK